MFCQRRITLSFLLVFSAIACYPAAAQGRYTPPSAVNGTSNRFPARRLLTLTFEQSLKSEQKSTCSFSRASSATTFDSQGFLVDVGANVPRYRTIDGNTGILVEGARTNFCANASFESGVTGWTTTGLTATRSAAARIHGSFGLQLTNAGASPADATFRATPPASQGTLALSLYVASPTGADLRMSGLGLLHNGTPLQTAFSPEPRPGWCRLVARSDAGGASESFGL